MAAILQTGEINRLTRVSVTESILWKLPMPHKKWDGCACANSGYKALSSQAASLPSLVPRLSCMGREKIAWYTLFVHAQFPQDFWKREIRQGEKGV